MKVTLHDGLFTFIFIYLFYFYFFIFAFRLNILFFCVARRTPTGGQSTESDGLSGAPVLPYTADSGEFHTHRNERSGLQRERGGLNVKQKQWMRR